MVHHRLVAALRFVLMALVFIAAYSRAQTNERLGSMIFPTSRAADLQKPFERAVSFLHSFVYEEAQAQLENIYYPLWFQPNAATIQHRRDIIQRAQELGAKTARERIYIDALATFCKGYDTDYQVRTDACAHAMQVLAARYPVKDYPMRPEEFWRQTPGGAPVIR